jgi:hypothetical protein
MNARRALSLALRAAFVFATAAPAQSSAASPVEREAAIVVRALSYEKTLGERVGKGRVGIGILYRAERAASERCAREWRAAFGTIANVKVQDRPIAVSSLPYTQETAARGAQTSDVHVLVVCDELGAELGDIARLARTQRILTVGTAFAYVEQKLTLGVFQSEGKYRIVVNLRAAGEERVHFSSAMLKLARIIR